VSDRIYFVLEGSMSISAGVDKFTATPGDTVFIPANTPYKVSGKYRTVTVNAPAFDIDNEVRSLDDLK